MTRAHAYQPEALMIPDLVLDPVVLLVLAGVLGALVGGLLTALIHRLPLIMDDELAREHADLLAATEAATEAAPTVTAPPLGVLRPSARCSHCHIPLGLLDTLPLVGYLRSRGRCRACGGEIPLYMPFIELITAALFMLATARIGAGPALIAAWIGIALLIALAAIDARTHLLPDRLTLPGLWIGLGLSVFGVFTDPRSAILGAILGYSLPCLADRAFHRITGRSGMGRGDFKLTALLGAWLGWQILPSLFLIAFGAGLIAALILITTRRRHAREALPFGPFLTLGGMILLVAGPHLAT